MVYINSQKFACASCIKGHRSSSCYHTERPLFEIKKKGRPVSQCQTCRQLRKNKRMHVKCSCAQPVGSTSTIAEPSTDINLPSTSQPQSQRKLFDPPAFPNGIKDLWAQETPSRVCHPKQKLANLLNPCRCKSIWKCKCHRRAVPSFLGSSNTVKTGEGELASSVTTEVKLCHGSEKSLSALFSFNTSPAVGHGTRIPTITTVEHREQRSASSMPYPRYTSSSPLNLNLTLHEISHERREPDLLLPPLIFDGSGKYAGDDESVILLPSLSDLHEPMGHVGNADAIAALTKCACGGTCICPGCKEHRGAEMAASSGEDCPDKCGSCVDSTGGHALPTSSSLVLSSSIPDPPRPPSPSRSTTHSYRPTRQVSDMSPLEHFYAIAALLPPPPNIHNTAPGGLDATNIAVYHRTRAQQAVGVVQIPALNCCAGRCKCPGGRCGCGSECGGSCSGLTAGLRNNKGKQRSSLSGTDLITGKENGGERPAGGCCASNKTEKARDLSPLSGLSRL
ncbi:hypothetical protein K439DRAFT_641457 [Ramaria rubella]|nr:hypothetical protein K439DRAFT_641457 [Ramaria rubella]